MEQMKRIEKEGINPAVVPQRLVRLLDEKARVIVPHKGNACEPQIELIRDGKVIRAIEITCLCGRRMRLQCEYEG
jgi:hypothetical protein